MALFETNRPMVDGRNPLRPVGMFGQFVGIFAAWHDARVTRNALSKLTDHELDDLGLHRGDIDVLSRRSGF